MRYYFFYKYLSRHFDITLLSYTHNNKKTSLTTYSNQFREYKVPQSIHFLRIYNFLFQEKVGKELSGISSALSAHYYDEYFELFLKLYKLADVVIHDSPYMFDFDIFLGFDKKIHIYNSYNLEKEMVGYLLGDTSYGKHIAFLEKNLVKESDLVFAISDEEKKGFLDTYKKEAEKVIIVKNGFDDEEYENLLRNPKSKEILFIGSAHPPNLEAVRFINNMLAPAVPECIFRIAGSCCTAVKKKSANVILEGEVSQDRKEELLKTTDIAINPMFHGSGTNLKMIEYLAVGIPTVATQCGARGLSMENGKHLIISDKHKFSDDLRKLLNSDDLKRHVAKNGYDYVHRNFSWKGIAQVASEAISTIKKVDKKELLLVLNDFPISNPNNGGAARINGLYSALSDEGKFRVVYLCFNNDGMVRKKYIADDFVEISVPKTMDHIAIEEKYNHGQMVSVTDVVCSFMAEKNKLYMELASYLGRLSKLVVVSHPYLYPVASKINKARILESHNCETQLKEKIYSNHPLKGSMLKLVAEIERSAAKNSSAVVCVSQNDKDYFLKMNPNVHIIENGFVSHKPGFMRNKALMRKKWKDKIFGKNFICVMLASAHQPNMLGLSYLCNSIAVACPMINFVVVGGASDSYFGYRPKNVHFAGIVNEKAKQIMLACSDIAVSVTMGGSGSSMKVAEYLSYGLPIIANLEGMRGWKLRKGKEFIPIDELKPADSFNRVFEDDQLRKTLSKNGLRYFEDNCGWNAIARKYSKIISNVIK